ncbi:MAG: cytochrome c-type biogenesis protein CcmH [Gammaproteobacteria bacterium]|jgi:cytochrome c-type biogenesis protein CcmH
MVFWIIAALLLLASLFTVLRPLRSTLPVRLESNRERNIAIAKERRNEINSAFETGDLTQAETQLAMQDLETALADELSTSAALPDSQRRAPKLTTPLILACIPLIAIGMYFETGTVNYASLTEQSHVQQSPDIPNLDELVAGLEIKVRENPANERGLFLLAQTYNRVGRHQESVATYQILLDLVGPDADLLTEQAEASVMQNQQVFSAQSLRLLSDALALDPHHIKARWLSGLGKLEFGNATAALEDWLWIEPDLQSDPGAHAQLTTLINDAEQSLGHEADGARQIALQSIEKHNQSTEHLQLAQMDKAQAADLSTENTPTVSLSVDVNIDSRFVDKVHPDDTVFVIAKAKNGPRAPLAVVRKTVADLPFEVRLNDSHAMLNTMTLSQFKDVVISARVSRSGQPIAQAGDIQSAPYQTQNSHQETIRLTLNEIVK